VRLYTPASRGASNRGASIGGGVELSPALLHFHGGGYIIGTPEMDDSQCVQIALALGILVVSVDYRLAPEHPFPAGLEDCYASLGWLHEQAAALGVDAQRVALSGNSAGAGLAAALAQLALDRGEFRPVFQALVYPMLDDRTVTRPGLDATAYRLWTAANNQVGWQAYLGQAAGLPAAPVHAVPARRADLRGLPPAWLGVGTIDLFHAECLAYAHKLRECGVPCELVEVSGAFHGFDVVAPKTAIAQAFLQSRLAALKKALA
jgi:acetyl esterase/lipase